MNHDLSPLFRYFIFLGTVAVSFSMVPEACDPIIRPAVRSWSRFKLFLRLTRERFVKKCSGSFWEIDMTKFEP